MSDLNLWLPELREANRTIRKLEEENARLLGRLGEIQSLGNHYRPVMKSFIFELDAILDRINEGRE
jgi:hypothetical protein